VSSTLQAADFRKAMSGNGIPGAAQSTSLKLDESRHRGRFTYQGRKNSGYRESSPEGAVVVCSLSRNSLQTAPRGAIRLRGQPAVNHRRVLLLLLVRLMSRQEGSRRIVTLRTTICPFGDAHSEL